MISFHVLLGQKFVGVACPLKSTCRPPPETRSHPHFQTTTFYSSKPSSRPLEPLEGPYLVLLPHTLWDRWRVLTWFSSSHPLGPLEGPYLVLLLHALWDCWRVLTWFFSLTPFGTAGGSLPGSPPSRPLGPLEGPYLVLIPDTL